MSLPPSSVLRYALLLALISACVSEDKRGLVLPDPIRQDGFGVECETDEDCTSGPCTPHAGTRVCSQPCAPLVPCPDSWNCVAPPGATDGEGICRSPFSSLCRPCGSNADCSEDLSKIEGCIDDDGAGSFCSNFCDTDNECPSGYACLERETVQGGNVRACSRITDAGSPTLCTCNAYLASLEKPALCRTGNDFGTCPGERFCNDGEWSACSAPTPSLDLPNGLDDDCDGDTDDMTCRCGDGTCDIICAETLGNCPCDCASKNDGICSPCGESPDTSPEDCCQSPGGYGCGDGYCLGYGCGENPQTCPRDCSTPCGNQVCERGETPQTCAEDCKHQVCGNNVCEPTDDGPTACPQDCAAFCGDCECDPVRDESVFNCPIDCGFCGDGVCSTCSTMNESATTCAVDCCIATPEFCNGRDDDCDGEIDEDGAAGCRDFHVDLDGDGIGRWDLSRCICAPEGNYRALVFGDCDDDNGSIGFGSTEICDGDDDDCDGKIDEDFGIGEDCAAPSGPCISGQKICDGPTATTCIDGPARPPTATCSALVCEDGIVYPPSLCDGAGQCVALPRAHCSGYDCDAAGRCLDACASDSDCRAGFICNSDRICERTEPLCGDDRKCLDEDWRTEDFCLVICVHRPREDRLPSDDLDGDGIRNDKDVCPETPDPSQSDVDSDGRGDACDPCSGTQLPETCNGRDDDCDGDTDEGFGVGLSCIPAESPCATGTRACKDGVAECQQTGLAPSGVSCSEARCESPGLRLEGRCDGAGQCKPGDLLSCQGFPCLEDGPRCATTCDPNCAPGYFCTPSENGGICAPKFINGTSCGSDAQCRSGHCVDGICCVSDCETPCYTCHRDDARGACVPASPETDPRDDCGPCALCDGIGHCSPVTEGPSPKATCPVDPPCGGLGRCDGEGACSVASTDTECLPAACFDSTLRQPAFCDGEGTCAPPESAPCPGDFACLGDLACRQSCTNDQHCKEGYFCNRISGSCLSLRSLGAACANDGECESRYCVDGVCCESSCQAPCRTCAGTEAGRCTIEAPGSDPGDECGLCRACDAAGACGAILAGADPFDECDINPPCGRTGLCNGAGACALASQDANCGAASCVGGTLLEVRTCDGEGSCEAPTLKSCSPYFCRSDGNECATECSADGDCQSGFFCSSEKTCEAKRNLGSTCVSSPQCESGFCADGRCCESPCTGPCEACGPAGQCDPTAGADPLCGVGATCVGGDCRRVAGERCEIGSECASGFCADGRCCDRACDGECESCTTNGICAPLVMVESPECDNGEWCSSERACEPIDGSKCDSDCPEGRICIDARCTLPRGLGESCTSSDGCRSGFCVDGICCSEPCNGGCVECVAGFCEPLARGESDPGICEGPPSVCDGDGGCALADGKGCATGGDCASGFCVDGICCQGACGGECERCVDGVCEGVSGASDPGTCNAPSICAGRNRCASGAAGQCSASGDCVSGHCNMVTASVGFCCDSACSGPCQTCFGEETGKCDDIVRAENPGRCEGVSWCGPGGECVPKAGSTCGGASDCDEGYFCNIGVGKCEPLKTRGANCSEDASCSSGFCVDGRCCESACDGLCEACNAGGRCEPAASGTDPDSDCPAGETCSREVLGCAGESGQICLGDSECASGYCADGVCCDRSCSGACESCIATPGTCESVAGSQTDRCEGPFICDALGACRAADGASCQSDNQCASGLCGELGFCCAAGCTAPCEICGQDGQCTLMLSAENPGRCEGEFACDHLGECVSKSRLCENDDDCTADFHCALGRCVRDAELGVECDIDSQCLSGVCRDGRCCESDCGGRCETCSRAGYEGKCVPAAPGTNPHESCPPKSTCNSDQACVGLDGIPCETANECSSGHCVDGVCCSSACEDACESCILAGSIGTCTPLSGPDLMCGPNATCVEGDCLKALGVNCLDNAECASTKCGDTDNTSTFVGVCCDSACDGACVTCTGGRCSEVTRAFDAACVGANQWCDMNGQCRAVTGSRCDGDDDCPESHFCAGNACAPLLELGAICSDSVQCSSGFCADGRCCESACDGSCRTCGTSGRCEFTNVGTNDGCTAGEVCDIAGGCAAANGVSCNSDSQCASRMCRDGVCCGSRCDGVCERCNALGECEQITMATDPGMCDGPLMCSTTGTCRFRNSLGCALDSQCASGHCVDGVCCNSACGGPCVSCVTAGFTGLCRTIQYADDPLCGAELWCGQGGICAAPVGEPCLDESQCPGELVCADPNGLGFDICSPPFSNGAECVSNSDCESGFCVDGTCCSTACDGPCQACNNVPGSCIPLSGMVDTCQGGTICVDGACALVPTPDCTQTCAPGTTCVSGVCVGGSATSSCVSNEDCASGMCVNNACVTGNNN